MSVTVATIDATTLRFPLDSPEINMNNSNAGRLLRELGYGEDVAAGDLCGTADAADFQRRVVLAQANAVTDYDRDRLNELYELAQFAVVAGCKVTWA